MNPRVSVVSLGRDAGMGERRRVEVWREILTEAGVDVSVLALLDECKAGLRHRPDPFAVAAGHAAPETLAWSPVLASAALRAQRPDAIVCVTFRAHHPHLQAVAPVVLDFVDRLSASYRDRAALQSKGHRRIAFATLSRTAARVERTRFGADAVVAAGFQDAASLDATWVPNTVAAFPAADAPADHDLVFFGNLSYPPNVAAVRSLDALWPRVASHRPGTSLLLAGARPAAVVVDAAGRNRWTLLADFEDLATTVSRARLAVAPLAHAAGIQNKILEAAAIGVAQVVSPAATSGFAPGLPVRVAATDEDFVAALSLLDDVATRETLARDARAHVRERYSAAAWTGPVTALLTSLRSGIT
jgi:hypothetical protein